MWRLFVSLLFACVPALQAGAADIRLLSHRAGYELTLLTSNSGSGIAELEGKLLTEWSEECEGFVTSQHMKTVLTDVNGREILNEINVASWESRDGERFRFSTRHDINHQTFEAVRGEAARTAGGARVAFQEPEVSELELPASTLFPTQLMVSVLRDAEAGKRTAGYRLFDGGRLDSHYDVFVVFGERRGPEDSGRPLVEGQYSWPVTLAYFPVKPREDVPEGTPEQEIGFVLYANGVAAGFRLTFQDYAIKGELSDLEALPASSC